MDGERQGEGRKQPVRLQGVDDDAAFRAANIVVGRVSERPRQAPLLASGPARGIVRASRNIGAMPDFTQIGKICGQARGNAAKRTSAARESTPGSVWRPPVSLAFEERPPHISPVGLEMAGLGSGSPTHAVNIIGVG